MQSEAPSLETQKVFTQDESVATATSNEETIIVKEVSLSREKIGQAKELNLHEVVKNQVEIEDSAVVSELQTETSTTPLPRRRKVFFGRGSSASNFPVPFQVEVARFLPDSVGNIHLVNEEGRSLATAGNGALIPVREQLPAGLAPTFKITPVFISGLGGAREEGQSLTSMIKRVRGRFF